MMERTKKTLLDGLERHGLSVLAQTWPYTATAQSKTQSDRQLCAKSGRREHHDVFINGKQVTIMSITLGIYIL